MRMNHTTAAALALSCLLGTSLPAGDDTRRNRCFDDEETGKIARGFTNAVGEWSVVASDKGKAMAQTAKNPNSTFNITLAGDTHSRDVDLSVRMKAVAGETDQGGGLVWRARDAKNYDLARDNPLEDNFRLYKVVAGHRTLLQNADIPHSDGWHTLRVAMAGDRITCFDDGTKHLDAKDATFPEAGKVGLWSKADARSQFDDLTLAGR